MSQETELDIMQQINDHETAKRLEITTSVLTPMSIGDWRKLYHKQPELVLFIKRTLEQF